MLFPFTGEWITCASCSSSCVGGGATPKTGMSSFYSQISPVCVFPSFVRENNSERELAKAEWGKGRVGLWKRFSHLLKKEVLQMKSRTKVFFFGKATFQNILKKGEGRRVREIWMEARKFARIKSISKFEITVPLFLFLCAIAWCCVTSVGLRLFSTFIVVQFNFLQNVILGNWGGQRRRRRERRVWVFVVSTRGEARHLKWKDNFIKSTSLFNSYIACLPTICCPYFFNWIWPHSTYIMKFLLWNLSLPSSFVFGDHAATRWSPEPKKDNNQQTESQEKKEPFLFFNVPFLWEGEGGTKTSSTQKATSKLKENSLN